MAVEMRGRAVPQHRRESIEFATYESGKADQKARDLAPGHEQPWDHVLATHEPLSPPCLHWLLQECDLRSHVRGKVLDVAAGTMWASAVISKQPAVTEVWAYDLSEQFLMTTGMSMFRRWEGDASKLHLAVGDFNDMPFEPSSFDTAFLLACVHHSQSPLVTLAEVIRCVRPGGNVFILELPTPVVDLARAREATLEWSTDVTEICYTAGEFEYLFKRACLPFRGKAATLQRRCFELHKHGWRMWARRMLAATRLDDFLRPCMSVYHLAVHASK